jgi:hypothetical protein
VAASASISSLGAAAAKTSTRAPAAESNSAFHVAAGLPPATTARLFSNAKNAGSRAKAPMRVERISAGVRIMRTAWTYRRK